MELNLYYKMNRISAQVSASCIMAVRVHKDQSRAPLTLHMGVDIHVCWGLRVGLSSWKLYETIHNRFQQV